MPYRPKRILKKKGDYLKPTSEQIWFLETGFDFLDVTPFPDSSEIERFWKANRAMILKKWKAEGRAGRRPWAWWIIERDIDPAHDLGSGYLKEQNYLIEQNLLEDWEVAEVERQKKLYEDHKKIQKKEKKQ